MRTAILLLLVIGAAPCSARAEDRKVIHDGIEMTMTKSGESGLEITYSASIPADLRELGVSVGTMLVRGTWEDKVLVGEAWAFSPECKSISYPVLGVVDYSGALVVFGPVPRSCKAGDSSWGKQALMRFEAPASPRAERRAKPRPERKKPRPAPRPQRQPQYYPQQQWPSYPQWWR